MEHAVLLPWDVELIRRLGPTSLAGIAQQGRLVRDDGSGPARVDLSWVDECALALIDLAVQRATPLCLVYPAPAGELSALVAAQLLLERFVRGDRSASVGIVTADPTLAARTWEELRITTSGAREPISTVFPCWRAGPNGESPLNRKELNGLLVGQRCQRWPVDVLLEDHLAGPVSGDNRLLTISVFADPLDRELAKRAGHGELVWGWSENDLAQWNQELETGDDRCVPFSVSHDRLATIASGVRVRIEVAHHSGAELAAARVREDLRLLRALAGASPPQSMVRGMAIAWHHFQTLSSLPCAPTRFDRFCGVPPWAPRATSTFEPEITAWARTLGGDSADIAGVLASDLADLRAALNEGNPFQTAVEDAANTGHDTLLVLRTRAAVRALLDAMGCDPDSDRVGQMDVCTMRRLSRQGTWHRAIAVGVAAPWDWHRLDSGIAEELRILVLGDSAAVESRRLLESVRAARNRWGSPETRERAWRGLVGTAPPPAPIPTAIPAQPVEITIGPDFVPEPDPFDPLGTLLDLVPLHLGEEGLEDRVARESEEGRWDATVAAVLVTTNVGVIKLEVGHPVEVRLGSRIVDRTPEQLEPGMCLLVGRRHGRLGLLEALEERLRHRRPDLLAARLLIDSYHEEVRVRFAESGLSIAELKRRLDAAGCDKTVFAVRSWVARDGILAPQQLSDLRRLGTILEFGLSELRLMEVFAAVQRRRGFRRAAGRILAEAARSSTVVADHARIDGATGLSVADLREAVVEAVVVSVDTHPIEVPLGEIGHLEAA